MLAHAIRPSDRAAPQRRTGGDPRLEHASKGNVHVGRGQQRVVLVAPRNVNVQLVVDFVRRLGGGRQRGVDRAACISV